MPNRILRDWTDSLQVDSLDAGAEVFLVRVIMKADDYGRFSANPKLLRSLCYPLRSTVRESDISRWLAACHKAGLLRLYVAESKPFLLIEKFGQQARSRSKYPDPPPDSNCVADAKQLHTLFGVGVGVVFEDGGGSPARAVATCEQVIPEALMLEKGFEQEWDAFRDYRKKIRKPLTSRSAELILATLGERPGSAVAALRMTLAKGWQGFEWAWFDNSGGRGTGGLDKSKTVQLREGEGPPIWRPSAEDEADEN